MRAFICCGERETYAGAAFTAVHISGHQEFGGKKQRHQYGSSSNSFSHICSAGWLSLDGCAGECGDGAQDIALSAKSTDIPEIDPVEFMEKRIAWRYAMGVPAEGNSFVYLGGSHASSILIRRQRTTRAL